MLQALGLDPAALQAVQAEHTQVLPGLDLTKKKRNEHEKKTRQNVLDQLKSLPAVDEYYKEAADMFKDGKELGIKVIANGELIDFFSKFNNVQPASRKGRTFISAKALADALGAKADWNGTSTVALSLDGKKTIEFKADASEVKVSGVSQTLEVPASLDNGEWMVPLRFVSEVFGKRVGWVQSGDVQVISIHN